MLLLNINAIQTIIKNIGIQSLYKQLIKQLEKDFMRWHEFDKSPRHAIHYKQGVIELMPCSDDDFYSFKYVNGHPNNTKNGNLCVVAMGLLADTKSGYPLMITEMTLLTAIRTAAVSALGVKYLAKKNATSLCIIGCGAQSEFQAMAIKSVMPISNIKIYDIDNQAMHKFTENMRNDFKTIQPCKSISEAIHDVDIIITATAANKRANLFSRSEISDGTHIHAMGGDGPGKTELNIELLKSAKIIVEFSPQSLVEGEIQQLNKENIYAELWQVIKGEKKGRENSHEITIFDAVGFAIEDHSILNLIYQLANKMNIGEDINLIPNLDNPKNLYSLINSV